MLQESRKDSVHRCLHASPAWSQFVGAYRGTDRKDCVELYHVSTEEGGEEAPLGKGLSQLLKGRVPSWSPYEEGRNTTSCTFSIRNPTFASICCLIPSFESPLTVNLHPAARVIFLKHSFDQATLQFETSQGLCSVAVSTNPNP